MVAAVIQARMNSARLPGKILKEVCGKPLLELLIERVKCCQDIDEIIVATTVNKNDDGVEELARRIRVKCFRGSEDDVLDRFYWAAKTVHADHVVRITGDCPLVDPAVAQRVIACYLKGPSDGGPYDYASNTLRLTFPDGLDVEVLGFPVLERLHRVADKAYQREHVTTYVVEHPDEFKVANVPCDRDLSRLRWTVDTLEDFELVKNIFEGLYPQKPIFYMEDILKFLERNTHLADLNKGLKRNEGFIQSLSGKKLSGDERREIIDNVLNKRKLNEV